MGILDEAKKIENKRLKKVIKEGLQENQLSCPQECQNNHSEHRITMTKIFGKLENIETKFDNLESKLEDNNKQHKEILDTLKLFKLEIDKKADKKEVDDLKEKLEKEKENTWTMKEKVLVWLVAILLVIIGFFVAPYFIHP